MLIETGETNQSSFNRIPIWVYEIKKRDIFPVKFEYKQRGYKGLRFMERLSHVEMC